METSIVSLILCLVKYRNKKKTKKKQATMRKTNQSVVAFTFTASSEDLSNMDPLCHLYELNHF